MERQVSQIAKTMETVLKTMQSVVKLSNLDDKLKPLVTNKQLENTIDTLKKTLK